jgi:hypothetical protein
MTKEYDVITYSEGRPIIGNATEEEDGVIRANLWLIPTTGCVIYLKPKKERKPK